MSSKLNNRDKALKMMLWFGIGSLFMTFAGLTSAFIVSKNREDWILNFELPDAFYYSLIIIILSSICLIIARRFLINDKIIFGVGASIASILFFFSIGYASNYFSKYLNNKKMWNIINWIVIIIMSVITLYVVREIIYSINL